ncbi:MAG: methyltransferase domain-containing protein, partial [Deltaproteobacteria bacterium]|nr:methyltransferase domain-containing protein [Deltaproteobacteria bacterium]
PPSKTTRERIEIVTEMVRLFKVKRAADYGAGSGDICLALAKEGVETFSVDIPGKTSRFAALRYKEAGLEVKCLSPEEFQELPPEHLDLVTSFDVFEHLINPFGFVRDTWEKLSDGGIFILSADLHNFSDEAHIADHYIYEPFLIQLIENVGFEFMDSAVHWRPHIRGEKFTFGSLCVDCFKKVMAGSSPLERFQRMARRYEL